MKLKKLLNQSVWVIDDCLPDFPQYLDYVLDREYVDNESQGVTYKNTILSDPAKHDVIKGPLEKLLDMKLVTQLSFLRKYAYVKDYKHPMWIHSDVRFANFATVYFIRSGLSPQDDGLAFWEHVDLGERLETSDGEDKTLQADRDSLNLEMWRVQHIVPFKENRLVLFDAKRFHSKQTQSDRGTVDNCRLLEVGFYAAGKMDIPEVHLKGVVGDG